MDIRACSKAVWEERRKALLWLQGVSRAPPAQNPAGFSVPTQLSPLICGLGWCSGVAAWEAVVFLVISVSVATQSPQCNSSENS